MMNELLELLNYRTLALGACDASLCEELLEPLALGFAASSSDSESEEPLEPRDSA